MMNSNMAADCIVINWLIMQHKSQHLIVFILFVCLRNFSENFFELYFCHFYEILSDRAYALGLAADDCPLSCLVIGGENIVSLFALDDVAGTDRGSMSEALSGSWRKQSLTANASVLLATGA